MSGNNPGHLSAAPPGGAPPAQPRPAGPPVMGPGVPPGGPKPMGPPMMGPKPGMPPAKPMGPAGPQMGRPRGPTGSTATPEEIQDVANTGRAILNEVGKAIVGKQEVMLKVLVTLLANGHILFEDFPGLAKTLMANCFAQALGCTFKRIQFTPDLLPADITGTYVFDEKDNEFKFRPGPIFTNILLADEINRAPPKTQAALLEAMQERQVTIEGVTHKLPKPFLVMATQNPIEQEGTYPLPEAQVDRFMSKMAVGYPNREEEKEILIRRELRRKDDVELDVITNPKKVVQLQTVVEKVHVDPALLTYIVEIVTRTREDPRVLVGSSPRGSLGLFKMGRAHAVLTGRDYITPDDVKFICLVTLGHRIILKPEPRIRGVLPEDILKKILAEVPVPAV
jgi:MoxR-like ATPase